MDGRLHFYLFVSLEGVRSCGAWLQWTLHLCGKGGLRRLSRRKALQGESYRELANKLAGDRVGGGGGDGDGRGGFI